VKSCLGGPNEDLDGPGFHGANGEEPIKALIHLLSDSLLAILQLCLDLDLALLESHLVVLDLGVELTRAPLELLLPDLTLVSIFSLPVWNKMPYSMCIQPSKCQFVG
jgi:hypothetical protein